MQVSRRRRQRRNGRTAANVESSKALQRIERNTMDTALAVQTNRDGSNPMVPDVPRPILRREKVYTFSRTAELGVISGGGTFDTYGSYFVALSTLPSASDFTSLFDMYRITFISMGFVPLGSVPLNLITAIDVDDSTVPTSVSQLYQYDNVSVLRAGRYLERNFVPGVSDTVYNSATTSGYGVGKMQWIDAGYPDVPHYGLKWCVPFLSGQVSTSLFRVVATCIVQCKHPR